MEVKEGKLTVIGEMDAYVIVKKLKKICCTEIISIGPVIKEPEKKNPEPKKPEPEPYVIHHYTPPCPPYYCFENGCCACQNPVW